MNDELSVLAHAQGLQVLVTTYGGSGSNVLRDHIHKYRSARCAVLDDRLCHYAFPLSLDIPRICILGDPVLAFESMARRGLLELNAEKMVPGSADVVDSMMTYFRNWTSAAPLIFIKYEHLWRHLGKVLAEIGVSASGFPSHQPRASRGLCKIDERLLLLQQEWRRLPEFFTSH